MAIGDLLQAAGGRGLKVTTAAGAILLFTGERPIVEDRGEYTEISFTPAQEEKIRALLDSWHASAPGDLRINIGGILARYYLKKYWLYLAAAFAVGIVIGGTLKT